MGGLGSGRYYGWSTRATLEDCISLDIHEWKNKNLLEHGSIFTYSWSRYHVDKYSECSVFVQKNNVYIIHKTRDDEYRWGCQKYWVTITWSACNYGGKRPWFICPSILCERRVSKLYGGSQLLCRRCRGLAYKSQRESPTDRACRRADKIREKLKWEPGILNGNQLKPKGMHWQTFNRLVDAHNNYVAFAVSRFGAGFGSLGYTLDDLF